MCQKLERLLRTNSPAIKTYYCIFRLGSVPDTVSQKSMVPHSECLTWNLSECLTMTLNSILPTQIVIHLQYASNNILRSLCGPHMPVEALVKNTAESKSREREDTGSISAAEKWHWWSHHSGLWMHHHCHGPSTAVRHSECQVYRPHGSGREVKVCLLSFHNLLDSVACSPHTGHGYSPYCRIIFFIWLWLRTA